MRGAQLASLVFAVMAGGMVAAVGTARAADKIYVYNLTSSTDFKHVYLAPPGTEQWGRDEGLNDHDGLQTTERLLLKDAKHAVYDVKLVDANGRTCVKHGVDLTREKTFDVRDADLADCK